MRKNLIILVMLIIFFQLKVFAVEENHLGIGIILLKEPYNHKTIVLDVLPNSPAEKVKIPLGASILKVNNIKTKNLSIDEVLNLIKGPKGSHLTLTVKTFSFLGGNLIDFKSYKSVKYDVIRDYFNVPVSKYDKDKRFLAHWQQVAPIGLEKVCYIPNEVDIQLSRKYRLLNDIYTQNYWYIRRKQFEKGYDACLSYSIEEQNNCLINLVNREITQTNMDKQNEIYQQQNYILNQQLWMLNNTLLYK